MKRTWLALLAALTLALTPTLVLAQNSPFPYTAGATLHTASTALGNGNTLQTALLATVTIQAVHTSGTTTLTFEASNDGVSWGNLTSCYVIGATSASATMSVTTSIATTRCNVTGIGMIRARISTCTSCVGVKVVAFGSSVPLSSTLN